MFVAISYDIPSNRRRRQMMRLLKSYGEHVQESVFECDLNKGNYARLLAGIRQTMDMAADNVRVYQLCEADVKRIRPLGVSREVQLAQAFILISQD